MLNKIELGSKSINLKESDYLLEVNKDCDIEINVEKNINTKLIITGFSNYHLKINILDNAHLIVNSLNINNSVKIEMNLSENTSVNYNHSVSSNIDSNNSFIINHLHNNSTSFITNNGINLGNNKLYFEIDGVVPKKLNDIVCNQFSKIINFQNGDSKIIPNLIIDSNDISANHSSYIGKIDDNTLFYLLSRGLKIKEIKKLIYKAVLLGKMELSLEEDLFNKIINEQEVNYE